jgi:nucleoside-diphosphate-sugar epimerase
MRVLVTGSSGRIGKAIVACLSREHDVVGLDRVPSPATDVIADLTDDAALCRAIEGARAVVHAAALHAPHVGHAPDDDFERINVAGTANIARRCRELGVHSLVFTSTTAVYGPAREANADAAWITEATPPAPRTVYHRTKLRAEALLRDAASSTLHVTVLRMSRCFPEPAPLMAAYRLHRGIDARDVAAAHERALARTDAAFRCYVVSAPTPFRPEDCALLGRDAPAVIQWRAPALAREFARRRWALPATIDRVYVSALATTELGWQPCFGPDAVLRDYDGGSPEVLPPRGPEHSDA